MKASADFQSREAARDHKFGERVVMRQGARIESVLLTRTKQEFVSKIHAETRGDYACDARRCVTLRAMQVSKCLSA
jgi:hypothetical protein